MSCTIDFLGTGNFFAAGRYWNSFVLDGTVLVEPCPISLPHLRRAGLAARDLTVVVISHFHADHSFGWPFLLVELLRSARSTPLFVVGPPGVRAFLSDMVDLAGLPDANVASDSVLDLRFVEVDGTRQTAGPLRFRAVEVDHVPHLACYGYLFEHGSRIIGYTGDTKPCDGLDELAGKADVLILECNGPHPPPVSHMDVADVEALRRKYPKLPLVLTHLGSDLALDHLDNILVPADLDRIEV